MSELPFTTEQIQIARQIPFGVVHQHLGAYMKCDDTCRPLDDTRRSVRFHVNYKGRDFRFVFTGDKFINELLPKDDRHRGGGGAIDFVKHLAGVGFVPAVKICLNVAQASEVPQ